MRLVDKKTAAALKAKAQKTGQWSKEHKRLGRILNRAFDANDMLRRCLAISEQRCGGIHWSIAKAAMDVGFSTTTVGAGPNSKTRVFIPQPRRPQ